MINTINVDVRDISDFVVRAAIRRAVTWTFRHLAGAWDVTVSASNEPGRWDLHVYGGFGHHVAHVLTAPECLAEHVERRLQAFLAGVVPPLPIAPRRPVLVPHRERPVRAAHTPAPAIRRFNEPRRKAS